MSNPEHKEIRLRDGRRLAYLDIGSPDGAALLYCHGAPSSSVEINLTVPAELATSLGARIIVPDRPGMGSSDFLPRRRIIDWPHDVIELMDALRIDTFAVLGSSAGSPYALVCGAALAGRVQAVGIVGGLAPAGTTAKEGAFWGSLATHAPALMRSLVRLQLLVVRGERARQMMAQSFPEPDRTLFEDRQIRDGFIACFEEACRNGPRGVVWEQHLLARPWGFDLRGIKVPVLLWQGERDGNVSAAHARYLAANIPTCRPAFYPTEAHLSIWVNQRREILSELRALNGDATR
jgi:pimeloyl-ACP methyl ester carboxylesterase